MSRQKFSLDWCLRCGNIHSRGRAGPLRPATIATTTTGAGVTAPRVVVAGGHSAGHIEPTMNFAHALRRLEPTAEITALGTGRGLDTTLIPAPRHPLQPLPPAPPPRQLNPPPLPT